MLQKLVRELFIIVQVLKAYLFQSFVNIITASQLNAILKDVEKLNIHQSFYGEIHSAQRKQKWEIQI